MSRPFELRVLADDEGSLVIGWLEEGVLYARIVGALSSDLGAAYATELGKQVETAKSVKFFGDAGSLTRYDLRARSAFVRVVLANASRFDSLTLLTWAEGIGYAARSVMQTLGPLAVILTERSEFEQRLLLAAPHAHLVLDAPLAPDTAVGGASTTARGSKA